MAKQQPSNDGSGISVPDETKVQTNSPVEPGSTAKPPAPFEDMSKKQKLDDAKENRGDTTQGTDIQAAVMAYRGEKPTLDSAAKAAVEAQEEQQRLEEEATKRRVVEPVVVTPVAPAASRKHDDK